MSEDEANRTMADVNHTNPYTGETFGTGFRRGPTIAADGGEKEGEDPDGRDADASMQSVDHTPPPGEGANRVWKRGTETTTDADGREDGAADE